VKDFLFRARTIGDFALWVKEKPKMITSGDCSDLPVWRSLAYRILKFYPAAETERLAGGIANNRDGANHQNKSGAEAPLMFLHN